MAFEDCELISLSKEAIFEIEQEYPEYINEIFEYSNYRLKKLVDTMNKAIEKYRKLTRQNLQGVMKKSYDKSKTAVLEFESLSSSKDGKMESFVYEQDGNENYGDLFQHSKFAGKRLESNMNVFKKRKHGILQKLIKKKERQNQKWKCYLMKSKS